MRRSAAALALVAALSLAGCKPSPHSPPPVASPTSWQEDSLPPRMYDWVRRYDADLQNWSVRRIGGHTGCWAAVADDRTLVMCPDGHVEVRHG